MGQWLSCSGLSCNAANCTISSEPAHDPHARTKWEQQQESIWSQYYAIQHNQIQGAGDKEVDGDGPYRILLMGLSGAGKSSLLYTLQLRAMLSSLTQSTSTSTSALYSSYDSVIPSPPITRSTERHTLQLPNGQDAIVYDTSGECDKRQHVVTILQTGCYQINRLVFVIDSSDDASFPLASHYLRSICALPSARTLPLLIVFTKQDIDGAQDRTSCHAALHVDTLYHSLITVVYFAATHAHLSHTMQAWSHTTTTTTPSTKQVSSKEHHYDIMLSHLHDGKQQASQQPSLSQPQPPPQSSQAQQQSQQHHDSSTVSIPHTLTLPTISSKHMLTRSTDMSPSEDEPTRVRTQTLTLNAPTRGDTGSFSQSIHAWRMTAVSIPT